MIDQNRVEIENRNHGYFTFFIGLWLLGWTAITGTMLYALIFDNNRRYSFLFSILIVLLVIGYFIWNQFLWNIQGKHILTFNADHLRITKSGTLSFFRNRRVGYEEIVQFDTTKLRKNSIVGQLWGLGGETIVGKCRVRNIYFGAGWTLKESFVLVKKLNKILKEKTTLKNSN